MEKVNFQVKQPKRLWESVEEKSWDQLIKKHFKPVATRKENQKIIGILKLLLSETTLTKSLNVLVRKLSNPVRHKEKNQRSSIEIIYLKKSCFAI